MKRLFRYFGAGIILLVGVAIVSYLQYRFDQSDVQHAVQAVRQARPLGKDDQTLEEKVAKFFKVSPKEISWVPEIKSKTKGTVFVRAVPSQGGEPLVWEVDVVNFVVKPVNAEAEALSRKPEAGL